ncbi:MAG: PilT/PilU family type 4a pilus ATPase [Candidatus Omnitrophica bacterium]|nr:PilT/PilU family type 4a pilus ATPase [Candidatus Omnitrophota bacterium]
MEIKMADLLKRMRQDEASDLHIKVGSPPVMRVKKDLVRFEYEPLEPEDTLALADGIMNDFQKTEFDRKKGLDFAYDAGEELGRFRVNVFKQRGNISLVLRLIKNIIPSFEDLHLPPILKDIALAPRGIVIVTGTTSSGKSTTLAAMIDYINTNKKTHIVTIEDPIEYLHPDKQSIINQREIGLDTDSFSNALINVVRQDPDVILVGEMRDPDTFAAALAASETGHLVFSTLHSADVVQTFDRILEFFPANQHNQIKLQLSLNLKAVIAQRLMPDADSTGIVPAVEILINTPSVRKLIHDNRIGKLPVVMQGGKEDGMQTFNTSLIDLLNKKLITMDMALSKSSSPEALKMNMKGIFLDEDRKILGG